MIKRKEFMTKTKEEIIKEYKITESEFYKGYYECEEDNDKLLKRYLTITNAFNNCKELNIYLKDKISEGDKFISEFNHYIEFQELHKCKQKDIIKLVKKLKEKMQERRIIKQLFEEEPQTKTALLSSKKRSEKINKQTFLFNQLGNLVGDVYIGEKKIKNCK